MSRIQQTPDQMATNRLRAQGVVDCGTTFLHALADCLIHIEPAPLHDLAANLVHSARRSNSAHIFGNGGSAAVSQHFVADFSSTDCAALTGIKVRTPMDNQSRLLMWINDNGWEDSLLQYVTQEVEAQDITIFLSSSGAEGRSLNILRAAQAATAQGALTYCITNDSAQPLARECQKHILLSRASEPGLYESAATALLHQLRKLCEYYARDK